MRYVITFCMLLVAAAAAQAQKPCEPKTPADACFIDSAATSLLFCQSVTDMQQQGAKAAAELASTRQNLG